MNSRWQRVQELLEAFELRPSEERLTWLERTEADVGVREEVLDLFAAMGEERAAAAAVRPQAPQHGPAMIGEYRVLERVGTGGRSVVYKAERDVAGGRQIVAVKVMLDHLLSKGDLERFRREQGILAGLRHAGISRFLDVGQDGQGFPYLVMEWIEGETLDRHCESLTVAERVELVAQVLDVLQAAHQQLIVHLDLKPGNILVERSGMVKLIDFGTAKLLDREGDATGTRQMTPRYASPEQLRGEPLGTASDLYSIGLTLYELVAVSARDTGRSVIANLAARAFTEQLEVQYAEDKDLEAILRKALRREPNERYRSAAEFAEDLRAWRDGRPVRAREQNWSYLAKRYAQRNWRVLALTGALVIAFGVLGAVAWRKEAERRQEVERAAATARFLTEMIESSATAASGQADMTVVQMIERAHKRIEAGQGPPLDVSAKVQASFAYVAREAGREDLALPIAEAALAKALATGEASLELAARQAMGTVLMRLGRCPDALEQYAKADSALGRYRGPGLARGLYLAARADAQSRCAGDSAAAIASYQQALLAVKAEPSARLAKASMQNSLALELSRQRRFAEARAAVQAGLDEAEQAVDGAYFTVALRRIGGQVEAAAGNPARALRLFEEAIARSPGVANRFEEMRLRLMAANQLSALGDREAALDRTRAVLSQLDPSLGASRWMIHADAAEVLAGSRECALALAQYETVDKITPGALPRDWLGNRRLVEAECLADSDPEKAKELARQAVEAYGSLLHPESLKAKRLARFR